MPSRSVGMPMTSRSAGGCSWQRVHIDRYGSLADAGVIRGAGPVPIFRSQAKASSLGIGVHVIDLGENREWLGEIPIVASPALPESIAPPSAGLLIQQPRKKLRRMDPQPRHRLANHRLLDRRQDLADVVGPGRPQQEVHVLWHEDISPDV